MAISSPTHADAFTSAQLLEWDAESQDSFIQTSVTMAGFVAVQNAGGKGSCVNDWYFKSEGGKEGRNAEIREAMRKFSNYHPTSVVLAVVEKACGSFTFE